MRAMQVCMGSGKSDIWWRVASIWAGPAPEPDLA